MVCKRREHARVPRDDVGATHRVHAGREHGVGCPPDVEVALVVDGLVLSLERGIVEEHGDVARNARPLPLQKTTHTRYTT